MLSYTVSANLMQLVLLKKNDPFTVGVTRSIMMLPEKKMRPRVADSRVGIFLSGRTDLNPDADQIARYSVIHRWNIQPSDSAAWARGELVEPVKPIVFYLDDAFPALWREPAKEGIERWNKAFEKIGFKNVVQVRDFPKNDPEFDPDNLKYSCIRFVPAQISNAMGPSWVDPSSGEIINASIIVYNDIIKLINNWRFCQTAQIDPRVRSKRMPDRRRPRIGRLRPRTRSRSLSGLHAQHGGFSGIPRRLAPQRNLHTEERHNTLHHGLCPFQLRRTTRGQGCKTDASRSGCLRRFPRSVRLQAHRCQGCQRRGQDP